jgi:hypothetical protein
MIRLLALPGLGSGPGQARQGQARAMIRLLALPGLVLVLTRSRGRSGRRGDGAPSPARRRAAQA